jgi:hypothetical protein
LLVFPYFQNWFLIMWLTFSWEEIPDHIWKGGPMQQKHDQK